jgi:hypothetical protein
VETWYASGVLDEFANMLTVVGVQSVKVQKAVPESNAKAEAELRAGRSQYLPM